MANLPSIPVNNDYFTLTDSWNLQKHLIQKLFNSSYVLQDRIYETQVSSLAFALDFYVKNKVGITNEELYSLAKMAEDNIQNVDKLEFLIDYNTDYNDAIEMTGLSDSTTYTAQTYLADDLLSVKRKYVKYKIIESSSIEINSTLLGETTIDVLLTFQSFRFTNIDSFKYKTELDNIKTWYETNFTILNLFEFEYFDRKSLDFLHTLKDARALLSIVA